MVSSSSPSSASHSPSSSSSSSSSSENPDPPYPTSAAVPTVALPPPAIVAQPPPSSTRRVPPPCWSVEETLALMDSYREKWYSLGRGNLKASHWDDVAEAIHSRCHNLPGSTPKTAVQCRHKVEKLRKRYRSEKQKFLRNNPNPRSPPSSSWEFFQKMEALEVGSIPGAPAGAPAATARAIPRRSSPSEDESSEDMSDEKEDNDSYRHETNRGRNFRSVHGLLSNGTGLRLKIPKAVRSKSGVPRNERLSSHLLVGGDGSTGYRGANHTTRFDTGFPRMKRQEGSVMEEMRRRVEKKRHREREEHAAAASGGMGEVLSAVRMLGEGFMRMEQMKMDMTREIHNLRMEMELKHMEMILDTHRRVVAAFVTGIVGRKRAKVCTES